MALSRNL